MIQDNRVAHASVNIVASHHSSLQVFIVMVFLAGYCGIAAAEEIAPGTPAPGITDNPGIIWRSARIDGDRIVWAESISNTNSAIYNIRLYNSTTGIETLVSPSSPDEPHNDYMGDERPVAISGNHIVWTKYGEIWLYDIDTGRCSAIVTNVGDYRTDIRRVDPDISGDIVIWRQQEVTVQNFRNPDIIAYNLTSRQETTVSHGSWDKTRARVSGSRIVWEDYRNGNPDIYLYDLATGQERAVCTASGTQYAPKISGDRIVWDDRRDGNYDVRMYDITSGSETVIAAGPREQEEADISGNLFVWKELPSMFLYNPYDESNRLMLYDISSGKEYLVGKDIPVVLGPAISGNRIIYMDLANIPADQREIQRETPVHEISLFTLDPARFPATTSPSAMQLNTTGLPVRSPDPAQSLPMTTRAPGFGPVCALSAMVSAVVICAYRRSNRVVI